MINNQNFIDNNYLIFLSNISNDVNNFKENLYNIKNTEEDTDIDYEEIYEEIYEQTLNYYNSKLNFINSQLDFFQNREIISFNNTGIFVGKINNEIKSELLNLINNFANNTIIDYHPGSNNKVRDLVHPSIYPYIKSKKIKSTKTDFWKRPYENSKYQWLPSEFKINKEGKCKIKTYINNLPVTEIALYSCIEKLFDQVLPEFENAWSYANEFYNLNNKSENIQLKNRTLQVITKIVQVTLDGEQNELAGSWHVEGMSHENIVATASCTLDMPEDFEATLYFKRTYHEEETEYLSLATPQYPPQTIHDLYHNNLVPVGKSTITDGSLIVFPNNFVHKVDMINKATTSDLAKTRTILVFWLINLDCKIKSTKHIIQQTYDKEQVDKIRLELMKERTFFKQTFNQREINLCEH